MAGDDVKSSRHDDRDRQDRRSHRDHQDSSRGSRSHRDRDRDDTESHRRSRSPSPRPRRSGRSPSEGPHPVLARFGVNELSSDDYFARSAEFKAWLAESKRKYLDEISSKDARRYFDRFVRRWNEGRLPDEFYKGEVRSSSAAVGSSSQTRHKWAFTNKPTYSSKEQEQLAMIRDNVDTLTNGSSKGAIEARDAERKARHSRSNDGGRDGEEELRRDTGWSSRPAASSSSKSYAETQLDREHREDLSRISSSESRRRARQDQRDEEEAFHGRATGRDRMLEKKRERNAVNREFASRRQAGDGIEMDDRDLYDQDPSSLSGHSRGSERGVRAMGKREYARQEKMERRKAEMQVKVSALKEKDAKTMEMFKAMAQERFGGGGGL